MEPTDTIENVKAKSQAGKKPRREGSMQGDYHAKQEASMHYGPLSQSEGGEPATPPQVEPTDTIENVKWKIEDMETSCVSDSSTLK